MKRAMVISPTGASLPLEAAALSGAAARRWPGQIVVKGERDVLPGIQLTVDVRPAGAPGFNIDLLTGSTSVHMDGTPDQNIETAAWVRSLIPVDAPRIIVCDQAWSMHADLPSGVTADDIRATIVDHSTPGWDANDPALRG